MFAFSRRTITSILGKQPSFFAPGPSGLGIKKRGCLHRLHYQVLFLKTFVPFFYWFTKCFSQWKIKTPQCQLLTFLCRFSRLLNHENLPTAFIRLFSYVRALWRWSIGQAMRQQEGQQVGQWIECGDGQHLRHCSRNCEILLGNKIVKKVFFYFST